LSTGQGDWRFNASTIAPVTTPLTKVGKPSRTSKAEQHNRTTATAPMPPSVSRPPWLSGGRDDVTAIVPAANARRCISRNAT